MTIKFWSQAGQDKFVYEHIPSPGTFLDVGCNDPKHCSNSYALELLGWKGLLIDNDPMMIELCKANRTANPILLADATTIDWVKVCSEYGLGLEIDYLSLDIEGPELQVVQNLITAGFKFKVITFEHNRYFMGDEVRNASREFLSANGYTLAVPDVRVIDSHYPPPGVEYEDWWTRA
jgi:hypothetical protein